LIAYLFGNIFAKNCCNRTVYVKVIACQVWDVFLRHTVYTFLGALAAVAITVSLVFDLLISTVT